MSEAKQSCSKCGEIKSLSNFIFRNDQQKYRKDCKSCQQIASKIYRAKNFDRLLAKKIKWQQDNIEKHRASGRAWNKRNRKHLAEYKRKLRESVDYRIMANYRTRVYRAIIGAVKSKRTIELIGCSIDDLKRYIENKFTNGMSWDNYGKWHIDHILPCNKFNMSDENEQTKCFHYTNLQPLWALDNIQKGVKIYG